MTVTAEGPENDKVPIGHPDLGTARLEAYKQGVAYHIAQRNLFWTRNNIFAVAHGALATAIAKTFETRCQSSNGFNLGAFLLSIVGIITAAAWIFMTRRTIATFNICQAALGEAEKGLGLVDNEAIFQVLKRGFETERGPRLARLWEWLGLALGLMWFVLALIVLASPIFQSLRSIVCA